MKNNIFIGASIVLIIIAAAWFLFSGNIDLFIPKEEVKIFQEKTVEEEQIIEKAVLVISSGEEPVKIAEIDFKKGVTAFDLLEEGAEKLGLSLKVKSYDIGVFVEAIGNKENGQEGKYWLYYLNGEMTQLAADKQLLSPGDKVEFRFEVSPF